MIDPDFSRLRARLLWHAAYESVPIIDDDRAEADEVVGREVLREFHDLWVHHATFDVSVRLPIRLVYDQAMAVGIEIGPYDLDERNIELLRKVLATYDLDTTPPDLDARRRGADR